MSEATVIENTIPDGWYEDPAKPDMQRWWADNAWTEHVRYAEKKRLRSVALAPLPFAGTDERFAVADDRPFYEERPVTIETPAVIERPFYEERPAAIERPFYEERPVVPVLSEQPFYAERPALTIVEQPRFELPTGPTTIEPQLDNFYVPMARSQPHPIENTRILPQRRWGRAIAVWAFGVAVTGVSAGAALWVFLPR